MESVVWSRNYKEQEPLFKSATEVEKEFNFYDGNFAHTLRLEPLNMDVNAWPADTANTMHGEFWEVGHNMFKIKDRNGKEVKFSITVKLQDRKQSNVTVDGQRAL